MMIPAYDAANARHIARIDAPSGTISAAVCDRNDLDRSVPDTYLRPRGVTVATKQGEALLPELLYTTLHEPHTRLTTFTDEFLDIATTISSYWFGDDEQSGPVNINTDAISDASDRAVLAAIINTVNQTEQLPRDLYNAFQSLSSDEARLTSGLDFAPIKRPAALPHLPDVETDEKQSDEVHLHIQGDHSATAPDSEGHAASLWIRTSDREYPLAFATDTNVVLHSQDPGYGETNTDSNLATVFESQLRRALNGQTVRTTDLTAREAELLGPISPSLQGTRTFAYLRAALE